MAQRVTATISLAFRFHTNFYHSYRGDTLDENGIGKDIRIIRHIIRTLDNLNADGIPVRGTWDAENLFSLERMIPQHSPDILAGLQRRHRANGDEIELMSYNNGLLPVHTLEELELAVCYAISNDQRSGVNDLFDSPRMVMRPQEMMWTPALLDLLPSLGVEALSLYCSVVPFNTFGSFIPAPPVASRYNPVLLASTQSDYRMPMIPAVNHGDLADHVTLKSMIRWIRRRQVAECPDRDLLVVVDLDADDEFWVGIDIPAISRLLSTTQGLGALVRSVSSLPYLRFDTPGDYLDSHPPVDTVTLDMDTADGAFDGYASWAEKWENHQVYAVLERARRLGWLLESRGTGDPSMADRLRLLSTTHFGLSAPVMNLTRLADALTLGQAAVERGLDRLKGNRIEPGGGRMVLWQTGDAAPGRIRTFIAGSRSKYRVTRFVRLPSGETQEAELPDGVLAAGRVHIGEPTGETHDALRCVMAGDDLLVTPDLSDGSDLTEGAITWIPERPSEVLGQMNGVSVLQRGDTSVVLDGGTVQSVSVGSCSVKGDPLLRASVVYDRKVQVPENGRSSTWLLETDSLAASLTESTIEPLGVVVRRLLVVSAYSPGVSVLTVVAFPETPEKGCSGAERARLERGYDIRWREIRINELCPDLEPEQGGQFTVWRQNYLGKPGSYVLPHRGAPNRELDSSNNAVAQSWIAVSGAGRGLLVAQGGNDSRSFGFCPLRLSRNSGGLRIQMNPFGTYWGKQPRSAMERTGLGHWISRLMAEHLRPLAPSYSGRVLKTELLLVPYTGMRPSDDLMGLGWDFSFNPEISG